MIKIFLCLSILLLTITASGPAHAQESKTDSLKSFVHLIAGRIANKCGQSEFAEKEFKKAAQLNRESRDASIELGKLCLFRGKAAAKNGNYVLAKEELNKAIALDESNYETYEAQYELGKANYAPSTKSKNQDDRLIDAKRASGISGRILAEKNFRNKSASEIQGPSPLANLAGTPHSVRAGVSAPAVESNTDMFGRPAGTYERSIEKMNKEAEALFKHPSPVRIRKRRSTSSLSRSSSASGSSSSSGSEGGTTYGYTKGTGVSIEITKAQSDALDRIRTEEDQQNFDQNVLTPAQREAFNRTPTKEEMEAAFYRNS